MKYPPEFLSGDVWHSELQVDIILNLILLPPAVHRAEEITHRLLKG